MSLSPSQIASILREARDSISRNLATPLPTGDDADLMAKAMESYVLINLTWLLDCDLAPDTLREVHSLADSSQRILDKLRPLANDELLVKAQRRLDYLRETLTGKTTPPRAPHVQAPRASASPGDRKAGAKTGDSTVHSSKTTWTIQINAGADQLAAEKGIGSTTRGNYAAALLIPPETPAPRYVRVKGSIQCHGCYAKFPFDRDLTPVPVNDSDYDCRGAKCPKCDNGIGFRVFKLTIEKREVIVFSVQPGTSLLGQVVERIGLQVDEVATTSKEESEAKQPTTWREITYQFINTELGKPNPDFPGLARRIERFTPLEKRCVWITVAPALGRRGDKVRSMKCYLEALKCDPSPDYNAWDWLNGEYDKEMNVLARDAPRTSETVARLSRDFGSILDG